MSIEKECFAYELKYIWPKTFNALVEMCFVDYGGRGDFPHMRDTHPRDPLIAFVGEKQKDEQAADKVADFTLTQWAAVFGTWYYNYG